MRRFAVTILFFTAIGAAAEAQELTAAVSVYRPFGVDDLDGRLPASAEVRITIPVSGRFAIEPFATVGSDSRRVADAEGFYGVQVRQRIARLRTRNGFAFATYGVAAYYSRYDSIPPIFGHVGIGLHRRVSKYLAFRPEVHLVTIAVVPIAARFVAGLSFGPQTNGRIEVPALGGPLKSHQARSPFGRGRVCQVVEKASRVIIRRDDVTTPPFSPPSDLDSHQALAT